MLASYDTTSQCLRHPGQPIGGICALCLKERLTSLACTRCGGLGSSRVACISCSCTPLECASKPVEDLAKAGHSTTIASLIERDLENSKRLNPKVEQPDRSDKGIHHLRRSRSISLGKSSTTLRQGLECRSARDSRRKPGPGGPLDEDKVAALETNATYANERSDGPRAEVPQVADADQKENKSGVKRQTDKDDVALKVSCEGNTSILVLNITEEKRGFPAAQARLTKAKSTGWVLNDGVKVSPSCSERRIPAAPKNTRGKRFGIFRRRSPCATTAILSRSPEEVCTELEHCGSDAKRKSCSDIPEPSNSVMGRNSNAKQEDTTSSSSSSSVSSLITTDCEGKQELRRCRSQGRAAASWSKSLLIPWWVFGRLARS